jgi:hypothetical protein
MKNIVYFLSLFFMIISCKPQPNPNIIVNASFKVSPNTKKIKLGDTLRLNLKANANFPTTSGGTYLFNPGQLSSTLLIVENDITGNSGIRNSNHSSFNIYTTQGFFERNTGNFMFAKFGANCINDEYNINLSIIPQKKDTFAIQILRGNLFNNRVSVGAKIDFNGNNQNIELLPTSFIGSGDTSGLYAFIVE